MKGLDLAERYFEHVGRPMLEQAFGAEHGRIAAGLVGDGSDCLDFDDELSRDHDWGPGFCLWLDQSDYAAIGSRLQAAYDGLPKAFGGFARHAGEWSAGRVGVLETGAFYRSFLGRSEAPGKLFEWLRVPENNLAACTSGKVFCDPLGEFSRIRQQLLGYYPEDVRRAKIAGRCMAVGQSAQYNFQRARWRDDAFVAQYAETKFCSDAMALVYLLNRRYAPYYKWLHRGIVGLERLGPFMFETVRAIATSNCQDEKQAAINAICAAVIGELQAEGLSDSDSRFLVDHGPIVHDRIADPDLRRLDILTAR